MEEINVYLANFNPDNMKYLVEILTTRLNVLKAHYYEVSFRMNGSNKNDIEITGIKEIYEIIPYLNNTFKNKSVKSNKIDEETANHVIKLIYDAVKDERIKVETDIDEKVNKIEYNKDVIDSVLSQYKVFLKSSAPNIETQKAYKDDSYRINKSLIGKYLREKRGIK